MICNYDLFLESKALELIKESVIYYSRRLRLALEKLHQDGNAVASALLKIESDDLDIRPDITLLDFGKQNGYLSFVLQKEAEKLLVGYPNYLKGLFVSPNSFNADSVFALDAQTDGDEDSKVTTKSRQEIRIGKIIKKILTEKFTDKQIEEFVNLLKATVENSAEKFILVRGDDITYWYQGENYFSQRGTLGKSCMKSEDYFSIYNINTEVCQMLCLVEMGKLKGRAIVWKVEGLVGEQLPFEMFMDRVYTNLDSDVHKFRDYALANGWGYRTSQSTADYERVSYKNGNEVVTKSMDLKVKLKKLPRMSNYEYPNYPYMDTFKSYHVDTGILYNSEKSGMYLLEDTDGMALRPEEMVFSSWEDTEIPESESVWSEPLGTYILNTSCLRVYHGASENHGWWPDTHEDIVYDRYHGVFCHQEDAVVSKKLGGIILCKDLTIKVIISIDAEFNHEVDYMPRDSKLVRNLSTIELDWTKRLPPDLWIHDNLLESNYANKKILKVLSVEVYSLSELSLISKADAKILQIDIPEEQEPIYMDMIEYDTKLFSTPLYKKLIDTLKSMQELTSEQETRLKQLETKFYL